MTLKTHYNKITHFFVVADDTCMTEFTPGQIQRMKWALKTYRPKLISSVQCK